MNDTKRGRLSRCLLTWLFATGAAVALLAWALPDLTAPPRQAPFDAWLTWLCAVVTALCAGWGWLVTSVVVLEALGRRPHRSTAPGVPVWVRRLVLAACGVAVLGSTTPALAATGQPEPDRREQSSLLEGLPLPDRAEGRSVSEVVAQTISDQSEHHQVRPGDSLWSIAEDRLGDPTSWPRIHALNRDVVGPDPDLIRPGQLLELPDSPGEDHR